MKLGTWLRSWFAAAAPRLPSGEWGEGVAERYLSGRGFKILGRRVRVGRRGELDLVARDDRTLVFVEVKTRATEEFGRAIEAVDRRKRRALGRAALGYLRKLRQPPDFFRFDVVEVIGTPTGGEPEVRHIPNSFTLPGRTRWGG